MNIRSLFNIFAVAAALSLASPAMAQKATSGSSKLTKSHLEAAGVLMKMTGLTKSFGVVVPQLAVRILNNLTRTRPELRKDLTQVLNKIGPELDKEQSVLFKSAARVYAEVMNEQQIKETITFFKTSAGKIYLASQPKILDGIIIEMDKWNRDLSQRMMDRVRAAMKKKGHDL